MHHIARRSATLPLTKSLSHVHATTTTATTTTTLQNIFYIKKYDSTTPLCRQHETTYRHAQCQTYHSRPVPLHILLGQSRSPVGRGDALSALLDVLHAETRRVAEGEAVDYSRVMQVVVEAEIMMSTAVKAGAGSVLNIEIPEGLQQKQKELQQKEKKKKKGNALYFSDPKRIMRLVAWMLIDRNVRLPNTAAMGNETQTTDWIKEQLLNALTVVVVLNRQKQEVDLQMERELWSHFVPAMVEAVRGYPPRSVRKNHVSSFLFGWIDIMLFRDFSGRTMDNRVFQLLKSINYRDINNPDAARQDFAKATTLCHKTMDAIVALDKSSYPQITYIFNKMFMRRHKIPVTPPMLDILIHKSGGRQARPRKKWHIVQKAYSTYGTLPRESAIAHLLFESLVMQERIVGEEVMAFIKEHHIPVDSKIAFAMLQVLKSDPSGNSAIDLWNSLDTMGSEKVRWNGTVLFSILCIAAGAQRRDFIVNVVQEVVDMSDVHHGGLWWSPFFKTTVQKRAFPKESAAIADQIFMEDEALARRWEQFCYRQLEAHGNDAVISKITQSRMEKRKYYE